MQVSVIVCSHNPRPEFLRRTLSALREQDLSKGQWELLLVDNASKDPLSRDWDLSWHANARHIAEGCIGLTYARLRGIAESSGDLLVFVDDDNVLAADYLSRACSIASENPHTPVFGAGVLAPEFEVVPPRELEPLLPRLALRAIRQNIWSNNPRDFVCRPWGAGLCVTRPVAEYYPVLVSALQTATILDRRGDRLFCGGDDLFSWAAVGLGKGYGVFPELRLQHLIGAGRLTRTYFLRLLRDHVYSHAILHYMLFGVSPQYRATELLRCFLHGVRHGGFSMRCRLSEHRGLLAAAQFIAKHGLKPLEDGRVPYGKVLRESYAVAVSDLSCAVE
jgi:glycosyltransferase involved in cell wall biosynthesis